MLALYQLGTCGVLGVGDWMSVGVRGGLLGGLAALLLPLLFLWPRSGGLLIKDAQKSCSAADAAQPQGMLTPEHPNSEIALFVLMERDACMQGVETAYIVSMCGCLDFRSIHKFP